MSFTAEDRLTDQLLHQFKFSDNVLKLLTVLGNMFQDTLDAAAYLQSMVDLDDYAGEQLEFWGELIGVKRPKAQEDPKNIFKTYSDGEIDELDGTDGFEDTTDGTVTLGGYLEGDDGLEALDGSEMTDADYRYLILQKAASFRTRPTHTKLFNYLLAFGTRAVIDSDTTFKLVYDPVRYYDLNTWEKNYAVTRGIKPHSIDISFIEKHRNEDPI